MSQYVTTDTPLVTYLITLGHNPDITIENRKIIFTFENSNDDFTESVKQFQSGIAVGNIPHYYDTHERLKQLIRDLKRGVL